jgi:serine/threonine protein phosphatase PrpC
VDRMSIGDFARATGLTAKALRLYDEMGLVRPAQVDEYSGYRYYRDDQLNRALVAGKVAVPDISLHVVRPGDRFVLTTDGVHAVLPPGELSSLLRECATPEDAVTRVEDAVLQAGAPDNYAIVAVDLPG